MIGGSWLLTLSVSNPPIRGGTFSHDRHPGKAVDLPRATPFWVAVGVLWWRGGDVTSVAIVQGRAGVQDDESTARSLPVGLLVALGLGIALCWLVAIVLARAGLNPLGVYNGAFAVAFALYLVAAARVIRLAVPAGRGALALMLALALVPRLILLVSTPALSDDLYRYIWDGKVAAAGIDPYRYAPDAPELAFLRDRLWPPINQRSQHTPYPPAAQAVFALTYRVMPDSVKAQQAVAVLADLLVIGALLLLLGRLGLPRERVLLYAWSPTPVLHFAHSAHNDALMIAAVLLALALVVGPGGGTTWRRVGSGVALAVAALVKLVPLLLVVPLLRRWRVAGGLACLLTLLVGIAPFAASGGAALTGLGTEAGESVFNDGLHFVLVRLFGLFTDRASLASGLFSAALLGLTALWLAWRGGDDLALVRGATTLLALAILLNAVVEPWYLAWLLPFIAILLPPGAGRWPFAITPLLGWLWVSGAIQLTDLTYLDPANVRWWPFIRLVEYGPLLAILCLTPLSAARRRIGRSPRITA